MTLAVDELRVRGVHTVADLEMMTGQHRNTCCGTWKIRSTLSSGGQRGRQRLYSTSDLYVGWVLAGMRLHGLSVARLCEISAKLSGLNFADRSASPAFAVVTQNEVRLCDANEARAIVIEEGQTVVSAFALHNGVETFNRRYKALFAMDPVWLPSVEEQAVVEKQ